MAMSKIKKGDRVIVLTGKDKGRSGNIVKILSNERVVVEGINMQKKHVRPNPQKNEQGGIKEREASIHISNVAYVNPSTQKADRVGIKVLEDGRKVRYLKSNNELIDQPAA